MELHRAGIGAQTGLKDVNSDEGKRPLMNLPIGTPERPLHEAHVRTERGQSKDLATRVVGPRHCPIEISQTDDAAEVGDR